LRLLRRQTKNEIKPQITPLIDVVFLLIIFFMVVSEFSRLESEDMLLPESDQGRTVDKMATGRITINILSNAHFDRAETSVVVQKEWMKMGKLASFLKSEVGKRGGGDKVQVFIRAHRDTDFRAIKNVMRVMARQGVLRVSFAVSDQEAAAP